MLLFSIYVEDKINTSFSSKAVDIVELRVLVRINGKELLSNTKHWKFLIRQLGLL